MAQIGYHASHERFKPSYLLQCVQRAEQAGFSTAMCSDHFHPWSEQQGQSGFAWAWLGAALATTRFGMGTISAPGQRYHPVILAQAAATLTEMFPHRLWLALGSGQLLNEGVTGERWPAKPERNARVEECAAIIRALWAGETVTHHGLIRVEEARLYTRPANLPALFGSALTMDTARWAGSWADGLLTGGAPPEQLREMISIFRGRDGGNKPVYVQASHLYCRNKQEGIQEALKNWRTSVLGAPLQADLRLPSQFDAAAQFVRGDDMAERVRISSSAEQHAEWLKGDFAAGANTVFIHHVGCNQEEFIDFFGEKVLPLLTLSA